MTKFDGIESLDRGGQTGVTAVAEILNGNPEYLAASIAQGHAYFPSGCGFHGGPGQTQVHAKFEVASFSRCRNIKGEPPNYGELP